MTNTQRRGLKCPAPTDFYNISDFNYNAEAMDKAPDHIAAGAWNSAVLTAASETPCLSLFDGLRVYIKLPAANPSSPQLKLDGLTAKNILRNTGAAPSPGVLESGKWYEFAYNGTAFIVSEPASPVNSPVFTGTPTVSAGTDYGTKKLRNILLGTSAPNSSTQWSNGDIFIVYEQ